MATFILDRMLWCPLSAVDEERIKEMLTVHAVPYRGEPEEIELFEYRDDYIGVPRAWGIDRKDWLVGAEYSIFDGAVSPWATWPKITFLEGGGFWDGQDKAIRTIAYKLEQGWPNGCLLEAPPGTGKTLMALAVARRLRTPTLVLVHKDDLARQWQETARKFFGVSCGHVQGDKLDYQDHVVTTASTQTLYSRRDSLPDEFWRHFGFVIFDEGHRYPARTFERVMRMFPARYRLAVSATWRRGDRLERIWGWHVGGMGHRLQVTRLVGTFVQPKWETRKIDDFFCTKEDIDRGRWITAIARDPTYNEWLAEQVLAGAGEGRKVLLVSDRVRQLEEIQTRIAESSYKITVGMYVGSLSKRRRTDDELTQAASCDIILGTYRKICVSADQILVDPLRGCEIKMKDVLQGTPLVCKGKHDFMLGFSSKFEYAKRKPCVKIKHALGELIVSTDHSVLTDEGWKGAEEVMENDYLIGPRQIFTITRDIEFLQEDDLWLLGLFIGDGCLVQKGFVELASDCEEVIERADKVLRRHDMRLDKIRHQHYRTKCLDRRKHSKINKSWIIEMRDRFGMKNKCAAKHIPREFMFLPHRKLASLLSGLIDSDGWVAKAGYVGFSAKNKELVNQVNTLLAMLGVLTRKIRFSSSVFSINTVKSQARRVREILSLTVPKKKERLERRFKLSSTKLDRVPLRYIKELKRQLKHAQVPQAEVLVLLDNHGYRNSWLRQGSTGLYDEVRFLIDYYDLDVALPCYRWVVVKSVEEVGHLEVGDISVEEYKNYILSGVVVHNSEGTDIPALDTIFFGTPRSDVEQAVGRTQRRHIGKKRLLIVDPVFQTPHNMKLGARRKKQYEKIGFVEQEGER